MKASTLRLLPANHTCLICFDLKETFPSSLHADAIKDGCSVANAVSL